MEFHDKHILIIDDEAYVREMISLFIEGEGFKVTPVENPVDALKWLRQNKPNLILVDLQMEPINGHEFIEEVKANPGTKDIPVIVLSGQSMEEDEEQAISKGAAGYITKPVLPHVLLQKIKQFFAGQFLSGS